MSDEINQLWAYLAEMEAVRKRYNRLCPEYRGQIARLEAEAAARDDPWACAREQVKHLSGDGKYDIYNYAHNLETELESRPKVWCARNHTGDLHFVHRGMGSKFIMLFPSKELASQFGDPEVYVGQEK